MSNLTKTFRFICKKNDPVNSSLLYENIFESNENDPIKNTYLRAIDLFGGIDDYYLIKNFTNDSDMPLINKIKEYFSNKDKKNLIVNLNPEKTEIINIEITDKVIPEPTIDELKKAKFMEIELARFEVETGGIEFSGNKIRTDRDSQALITGAALQATNNPSFTCKWKSETGFVELNAEEIKALAIKVLQHVETCFSKEAEICSRIVAAQNKEDLNNIKWE